MAKHRTCGIYRIYHIESGKSYVGQSIRVEYRLKQHMKGLAENKHSNEHLQRAYTLYGVDAFATEVLEVCSQEVLTEREQFWMDFYCPTGLYNLAPAAGSVAGYKFTETQRRSVSDANLKRFESEEAKRKHGESLKGNENGRAGKGSKRTEQTKKNISDSLKGKKFSEAHLKAMSESQMGKKRGPHSEEHRAKLSEAAKLRWSKQNQPHRTHRHVVQQHFSDHSYKLIVYKRPKV